MSLTIVCGMPAEIRSAEEYFPHASIVAFKHSPDFDLASHIPKSTTHIISYGLCGGLAPPLKVGDIAIGKTITNGQIKTHCNWIKPDCFKFQAYLVDWYSSGIENEANSIKQRKDIHVRTGAVAIDNESFFARNVAGQLGCKFSVFRSVSDDNKMDLPPLATGNILNSDGSTNFGYLIKSLVSNPFQIPNLIQLGWDYNRSLDTLNDVGETLSVYFR